MVPGIVGEKRGMTRIFNDDGLSTPVTVIEVQPNTIVQIKTLDGEGYDAIALTMGIKKPIRVNKAYAGAFTEAKVAPGKGIWEFRVPSTEGFSVGQSQTVAVFKVGDDVKVTGTSKGKGFAGTIKRHHFKSQDATHGNSLSHRVPGSTGQNQTPGRVFKGKRMPGQLGANRQTIRNLTVAAVDEAENLIFIKGAVPGYTGSTVIIRPMETQAGAA